MTQSYKDFTATWIIRNVSFFENVFRSPKFNESIDKCSWALYFRTERYLSREYISLELGPGCCGTNEIVTMDVEMELCNSENEVLCTTEKKRGIKFYKADTCIFPKVLLVEELNKRMRRTCTNNIIVRCRMVMNSKGKTTDNSLNRSCTIQSTMCVEKSSYMRKVDYSDSSDWSLKLPFSLNQTLQLEVSLKANQDDILIEIARKDDMECNMSFRKMKCEITLFNNKGMDDFSNSDFFIFSDEFKIWHFPPFLKRSSITQEIKFFILKFTFTYSTLQRVGEHIKEMKHPSLPSTAKHLKKKQAVDSVTEDLRKMLFSKEHADVSLSVGNEVISAHKIILASRSPVFSAMFHQQMAESKTGVIEIQDMDAMTLKLFLEFLYTGELEELDWERMLEILLIADKYQVPSLTENCSQFLKRRFS